MVQAVRSRSSPRGCGRPRRRLPLVTGVPLCRRRLLPWRVFGRLCCAARGGVAGDGWSGGSGGISRLQHVDGLLLVRGIDGRGLRGPSGVCLGGQHLDALLSQDVLLLFLDGGRVEAGLAEPLGPLSCEEESAAVMAGG